MATLNYAITTVQAAAHEGTVVVLVSIGGETNPSGTTTYATGTAIMLTATPGDGFVFDMWQIASDAGAITDSENPTSITVAGGDTYAVQAVFTPIEPIPGIDVLPPLATSAIVNVLTSGGGTTSPSPGTYALISAGSLMLTATPNSGWQFSNWIISGATTDHGGAPVNLTPTDNPYNVNHGYGNTYNYQAVFTPVGSTTPTPAPTATDTLGGMSNDTWIIIGLVVVIVVILLAFGFYAMKSKK